MVIPESMPADRPDRNQRGFRNDVPLDLVKLTALMERGRGRPEIKIGLVDGPVAIDLQDSYLKTF
jgi:hypothetical protein